MNKAITVHFRESLKLLVDCVHREVACFSEREANDILREEVVGCQTAGGAIYVKDFVRLYIFSGELKQFSAMGAP